MTESEIIRQYAEGIAQREIARRSGIPLTRIHQLVHGKRKRAAFRRCPECGALHSGQACIHCRLLAIQSRNGKKITPLYIGEEIEINLKPRERERYDDIHERKIRENG